MFVVMQRWQDVGELGPIHRCDKLFGYVSNLPTYYCWMYIRCMSVHTELQGQAFTCPLVILCFQHVHVLIALKIKSPCNQQ